MEQPAMSWPEPLHENSLIPGEDEFSNFLEFNMQFPDLEGHGPGHSHSQQHSLPTDSEITQHPRPQVQYPGQMEGLAMDFNGQGPVQSHQLPYSAPPMAPGFCTPTSQSMPHQSSQHYMQGQPAIPPTPNSIELQGNAARYGHHAEENHEMYDRYARINEEQALYTPLVSPAMTPLENQFRLPEYTIPGEYFTPLTSPALEAQNANNSNNGYPYPSRQVSDVGFVPTTAEVNPLPGASAPPSPSVIRKTHRRRPSTTPRLAGRNKVKQSPSIRAQAQRKRTLVNANSEEFYQSLNQELDGIKPQNHDVRSLQASSTEGSGQDSVSPEPLSEPLMPPPALPPPRKSPAIAPQTAQSPGTAATPATLMRIQRSQPAQDSNQLSGQMQLVQPEFQDEVMEDIALPEAATPSTQLRPKVNRIDTAVHTGTASPVTSASVTPALEPRSATVDRTPGGSVAFSPRTVAMPSPTGSVPKKSEPSRVSSARKRPSLSSTHASPQLRPKISPSIQPLMRNEGESQFGELLRITACTDLNETLLGVTHDALYLASKSNYQHILDGTLPSGVSYPETLAENLSSKRTNHKLAEQGRRNRINSALKEIETLIPPEFVQARQAKEAAVAGTSKPGEKEKDKPANQAISKASAVEMAIDYIKALKMTLDQTAAKLAAAEANLAGKPDGKDPKEPAVNGVSNSTAKASK
ncbi:hypothetical protein NUU61_002455 [Penicillium alfredii]|uniref:BHLH domain-containing protein n=1 Tax=Penicillium alfredii TaxID=1506179 RepID=A0A9W9FRQ9_9EURO|nr:uncharacterized protein NUU61_002455 [Penicillium alfredii]KAJ5105108.1 hypothetical protein NUU61_002455 [Penicillium alfredii]